MEELIKYWKEYRLWCAEDFQKQLIEIEECKKWENKVENGIRKVLHPEGYWVEVGKVNYKKPSFEDFMDYISTRVELDQ